MLSAACMCATQDVVSLWLKATFRLIELLPTHPATASIFSNMTAAVAAPTQQHDSSTTDSSSATQSAQYAGETQGSSTQHVTVHVTNQEHHASGSQMLINVGLCTAGVAVMAFLVYRLVSKGVGWKWLRFSRVKSGMPGSRGGLLV